MKASSRMREHQGTGGMRGLQIASYAFLFPNEDGVMHRMLLPLLDLVNHGDAERANLDIMQAESGDFYAYALRDIAAGEEVRAAAGP